MGTASCTLAISAALLGGVACEASSGGGVTTDGGSQQALPPEAGTPDASNHPPAPGDAGPGTPVSRIAFAQVRAGDPAATLVWYRDVLGLAPRSAQAFELADGSWLELLEGGTDSASVKPRGEQSVVVGLQVPDLEVAALLLEERGVVFLGPMESTPGEDRWRYLADPEGNRLEIKDVGTPRDGFTYEAIAWAGVMVADFDVTSEWYERLLGPPVARAANFFTVFRLKGGAFVELLGGGAASTSPKSPAAQPVLVGLEVDELERAAQTLAERGLPVETLSAVPSGDGSSVRRAELVDPEGNRWVLTEP